MAGIGTAPCGAMIAEDVRDLQRGTEPGRRACYAGSVCLPLLGLPSCRRSGRSGSSPRRSCRSPRGYSAPWSPASHVRARPGSPGYRAMLEQMRGEAVPQRMQRHPLADPAALAAAWNSRLSWRVLIGCPACGRGTASGPAAPCRHPGSSAALGHHCRRQRQHAGWQHNMPVLAALRLDDADDVLRAVDIPRPQPDHFAGPKAAAIGQRQHHPYPERLRRGQQLARPRRRSAPAGSLLAGVHG